MTMKKDKYCVAFSRHCGLHHLPLQLMKAAVPAESYTLFIFLHHHLESPAMSTGNSQVGAALSPSF